MTKYSGGRRVGEGTYCNVKTGSVVGVRTTDVLPGDDRSTYYRIPIGILFPLGIVLGGFYIVVLPVLITVTAVYLLGLRIAGGLLGQVRRSVTFGWRPSEAYLAGKKKREKK
jgi:hypothetical protein